MIKGNRYEEEKDLILKIKGLEPHPFYLDFYGKEVKITQKLLDSINDLEFIHTPLLNPEGLVLSGWKRIKAWEYLGHDTVRVNKLKVPATEKSKKILKDNEKQIIVEANATIKKSEFFVVKEVQFLMDLYSGRKGRPPIDTIEKKVKRSMADKQCEEIVSVRELSEEYKKIPIKGKSTEIVGRIVKMNPRNVYYYNKLKQSNPEHNELIEKVQNGMISRGAVVDYFKRKELEDESKKAKKLQDQEQ